MTSRLEHPPSLRRIFSPSGLAKQVPLLMISLIALAPLYFLVITSLKTTGDYLVNMWGPPAHPTLSNFSAATADGTLFRWLLNSVVVTLLAVGATTVVSALAAYAFAHMAFRGRQVLLNLFIALMVVPPVVLIIPLFVFMVNINLFNTYWGAIFIYAGLMAPFSIYLLTNFFATVPHDLMESAQIDGATRLRVFRSVILPLSAPALITLIIVNSLFVWNELLIALTFLQDDSVRTLMAGLTEFKGRFFLNQPLIMAGSLIATIPMIAVYVLGQRYFVRGLLAGATK